MDSKSSKPDKAASNLMTVKDLLLWRKPRLTVLVFTTVVILLLDIMAHSVVSVFSMTGITVLLAAVAYRCFCQFLKWKKRGVQDEKARLYPQVKIDIPREETMRLVGIAVDHLNNGLNRMIELILVESWEDTLKCLATLCGLNLLGDCFNGITLILFGHILLFTLPKVYEWYQPLIDAQLQKICKFKMQDKIPETKTEDTENRPEDNLAKASDKENESREDSLIYKVCKNEQLFDLLEEEHRKGCQCRDCEHQD